MSGIPERLWNVIQGHWDMMTDRTDEADAVADAYAELTGHLRAEPAPGAPATETPPAGPDQPAGRRRAAAAAPARDPLAVSYALLDLAPGADLAGLEAAYSRRLAELAETQAPPDSAQARLVAERRRAVDAAYERLRDALNPTETRFEKIEF